MLKDLDALREKVDKQLVSMHALKFDHLNKHQIHEIWSSFDSLHHAADGILHQLLKIFSAEQKQSEEELHGRGEMPKILL